MDGPVCSTDTQSVQFVKKDNGFRGQSHLSHIHNLGSEPLKSLTLGQLLEDAANKYEKTDAIVSVWDNRRVTYKEVLHQADKLAAGFLSLGLEKGDRIGLWAPNIVEWVIVFYASARAGLVTVAINPNFKALDLEHVLNVSGTKALVCLEQYKSINFYDTLKCLLPELEMCSTKRLSSAKCPALKFVVVISNAPLRGAHNYAEVLNAVDTNTVEGYHVNPEETGVIQLSSGTTGRAKAICLSHSQVVNSSYFLGKRLGFDKAQHIICVQPPLFHVFGVVGSISNAAHFGATLVFPAPMYNSTENLKALENERCTLIYGTPTMYIDLINVQTQLKKKLYAQKAFIGAAPFSPELLAKIKDKLNVQQILPGYGATETSGAVFVSTSSGLTVGQRINDGYIIDHAEVKVVDNCRNIVPFGIPGELYVRGYYTMKGYLDDPDSTREVLDCENWYKTGDQFILYEDGSGKVVGRMKDMIIRGGENISPTEIEKLLESHPDILEAQVIGVKHERLGEEVCACVRLKAGVELTLDSIREFCDRKISGYKMPTQLRIMESFPRTPSGKVQKFLLRQQFSE
ncbi:medium-chain acyl-CoA ligase ACSF2, mitochondrial-like isoform X3 [Photinus pyralis]|nr:medium-chain acyl-CoA ligase ACSF2, mitochondrial-like isoform X3 [Photinus pyralis]XP_031351688.1 medium-chain acyl-CoA ligase ACSF2, mitochondrial-like isoform X3 [Photinus pyralis]